MINKGIFSSLQKLKGIAGNWSIFIKQLIVHVHAQLRLVVNVLAPRTVPTAKCLLGSPLVFPLFDTQLVLSLDRLYKMKYVLHLMRCAFVDRIPLYLTLVVLRYVLPLKIIKSVFLRVATFLKLHILGQLLYLLGNGLWTFARQWSSLLGGIFCALLSLGFL